MVRVTEVTVVEEPHVADVENFVVRTIEETIEILCWLQEVREPNQSWEICPSSLKESSSELNLVSFLLECGL